MFLSGYPIGKRPNEHTPDIMGTNEEPWMTRGSITFLYNYITKNDKYTNLLEYGCGSSTAYFLKVFNLNVTSIEHNKQWLLNVKNILPNIYLNKWKYYLRPSSVNGNCIGSGDDEYYDEYVNVVDSLDTFDIIIIDGRCRSKCINKTINKLNPGGLYVVDNAERPAYRNAINNIPKNWISHIFKTSVDTTIVWIKPII
jgi:hypothetical protein